MATTKKKPSNAEVRDCLRGQIDTLKASYTDQIGPSKGKIRDAAVRHQIACLERALDFVQ